MVRGKVGAPLRRGQLRREVMVEGVVRAFSSKLAHCVFFVTLGLALSTVRGYFAFLLLLPAVLVVTSWRVIAFECTMSVNMLKSMVGAWTWFNLVDENLYLGTTLLHPNDCHILSKKLQISAVLCALSKEDVEQTHDSLFGALVQPDAWKHIDIDFAHLPPVASPSTASSSGSSFFLSVPSLDTLAHAAAHINLHLSENRRVYVYCHTGQHHSCMYVLAYFVKHRGMKLAEAYDRIKRKRGVGFSLASAAGRRLQEFEKAVRGKTAGPKH